MTRHPLIRQGEGPAQAYARHHAELRAERQKLDRIAQDSEHLTARTLTPGRPDGDQRVLRAIPVIARGVAGAIPGTSPHGTERPRYRWTPDGLTGNRRKNWRSVS